MQSSLLGDERLLISNLQPKSCLQLFGSFYDRYRLYYKRKFFLTLIELHLIHLNDRRTLYIVLGILNLKEQAVTACERIDIIY